jgi:calcineurin-like phosphoesterase family protein
VGRDDIVYHLGDFCWGGPIAASVYRRRLNGRIHLIIGNHDKYALREPELWDSISHYKEANVQSQYLPNGRQIIILCHYAFKVWNGSHNGTWSLYGHSHGNLKDDPNSTSLDVGVDCWDFFPVSCSQLANAMGKKTFKPVDHHGRDNLDETITKVLSESLPAGNGNP